MKKNIHPSLINVIITCSCGNEFSILSTLKKIKLNINVCNKCHSFFSGKQKIIDTEKRIEFFKKKFFLK